MSKLRLAVWCAVFVTVAAIGWRYAVPLEARDAAAERARAAGHEALVGAPAQRNVVTWPGMVVRPSREQLERMAKTAITGDSYGGSLDICWRFPDGSDQGEIWAIDITCGVFVINIDSLGPSGDGVDFRVIVGSPNFPILTSFTKHVAYVPGGIAEARLPVTWSCTEGTLNSVSSTSIIGEKANATHAKEQIITESWEVEDAAVTIDVDGNTGDDTYTGVMPLSYVFGPVDTDDDAWDSIPGYVVSFEDMKFCGETVDLSAAVAQNWPGFTDKWVEGTADGTLGLWGHTPGTGHYNWQGGGVAAPFSYDFSGLNFTWMDGTAVDTSLQVYCTGLRNLSTGGVDIGPWHGTVAELVALGRVKQQHGFHAWDTWDADMQATVELYLDLTSAEALGIEVRGPQPAFAVAGCGWSGGTAWTEGYVSPYDGAYAPYSTYNGNTVYSNGTAFLYCTDEAAGDWGIGPGPPTDPYYVQSAGGPAGVFVVNTDSYDDDIIYEGTGQRQFSGLAGEGIGPAVSADTTEAISVDSDCATPSFMHDATFIFDGPNLAMTDRTSSPYMTDVVSIAADAAKSVYANAHDHEDWVGTNCTTPDADGYFTVGAGGGSLLLTLKCNYRDRQALVGGENELPAPQVYRARRHDVVL